MSYVLDATPLIYLSKAERLGDCAALDAGLLVPERVYAEVVERGIASDYPDARRVERRVEEDVLAVRSVDADDRFAALARNDALSAADVAVLRLAELVDGTAVMDERAGRETAAVEAIETRGTAFLLCSLVAAGQLTAEAGRETLDAMVDAGWYCSPSLYADVRAKLADLDD